MIGLLSEFSDDAEGLVAELAEVRDGTSEHLIDEAGPPVAVDLADLARRFQAGLVYGDDVFVDKVASYGDGPDALPDALHAIAERVRKTKPGERDDLRLIAVLRDLPDAEPTPAAG